MRYVIVVVDKHLTNLLDGMRIDNRCHSYCRHVFLIDKQNNYLLASFLGAAAAAAIVAAAIVVVTVVASSSPLYQSSRSNNCCHKSFSRDAFCFDSSRGD